MLGVQLECGLIRDTGRSGYFSMLGDHKEDVASTEASEPGGGSTSLEAQRDIGDEVTAADIALAVLGEDSEA